MSIERNDHLGDLLQDLDDKYISICATHTEGTVTRLDDLGDGAFEILPQIIDTAGGATLVMRTALPDAHRVSLGLRSNDDTGLWDVTFEEGTKTDELNISDILGKLKEIYS